jgi:hypothetical protein
MNTQLQKAAEEYVEETDYIDDNNRNLAGNAFIAGAKWAIGQARVEIQSCQHPDPKLESGLLNEAEYRVRRLLIEDEE